MYHKVVGPLTLTTALLLASGCTGDKIVIPPDTERPVSIREGDLVLAEMMLSPSACADEDGQWIEIRSRLASTASLGGLRLGNGSTYAAIDGGTIPPEGVAVGAMLGATPCHEFEPDFRFAPIDLSTGTLELLSSSGRIDAVVWDGWTVPGGASLSLSPQSATAIGNDSTSAWCPAWRAIGETGDFGTPGRLNPSCNPQDSAQPDTDDGGGGTPLTLIDLAPGDLVISEVHVLPDACSADSAQFVEVYNASGRSVDLTGLQVGNGNLFAVAVPGARMTPGTYAMLAVGDVASNCWISGVLADGFYSADVLLSQASRVQISDGGSKIFDTVDLSTLSLQPGASVQLSVTDLSADLNDDPVKWCRSDDFILSNNSDIRDYGSPGAANRVCDPTDTAGTPTLLGQDLRPGDLVITEAMSRPDACGDASAEYFEVFNTTGQILNLRGLEIVIDGQSSILRQNYPIGPAAWAIAEFHSGASPGSCYTNLAHDFLWNSNTMPDEGTTISLVSLNGVVDAVDLTGLATESGASLSLDPTAVDVASNDDPGNWCISQQTFTGSQGDRGTPKVANPSCNLAIDTSPTTDTSGLADTTPTIDTSPPPILVRTADQLVPGDIVITEIMPNPVGCPDYNAEYFEVFNTTPDRIDLAGIQVIVNGSVTSLTQHYTLEPGEWGVAEYYSGATFATCYGGLMHDFVWTRMQMPDTGTTIELRYGATTVDIVYLGGQVTLPGSSLQLDAGSIDATLNDDNSNWCQSEQAFLGSLGDLGSPGVENAACPGASTDTGPDTDTDTPSGGGILLVPDLQPGDLIITEFLADPVCQDYRAEYIEFFNNTDSTFDPAGLMIGVGGGDSEVNNTSLVPPRSYGVARYSTGSPPSCYSFPYQMRYPTGTMGSGGPSLRLSRPGTIIDEVITTGWPSVLFGASAELDPSRMSATLNDDPAAWCVASTPIPGSGGSDLGSPGEENTRCLPVLDTADTAPDPDTSAPPDSDTSTTSDSSADTDASLPDTGTTP